MSPRFHVSVFQNILMPTSVHIPKALLLAVDRRAKARKISRNRLIVQALEREVTKGGDWPEGFFEKLQSADPELVEAIGEMSAAIESSRRSKGPPKL